MTTKEGRDPFFTAAGLREGGLDYIGDHDPRDPYLSPAIAGDLSGLPPILVQAGTDEVLLDDSTRLAVRARDAEVDVVLDVVAGVPHVFPAFVGVLDEADDALERAALFLTQRVRRGFPG